PTVEIESPVPTVSLDSLYGYLDQEMDRLTDGTVVYDEYDTGAAGFYPINWSGDVNDLTLAPDSRESPFSGNTCLRITYQPAKKRGWVGVTWAYPNLSGGNWGERRGRVLVGATELTGWIRGKLGGEQVRIEVGGINEKGRSNSDQPNRDTLDLLKNSPKLLKLTTSWQPFKIEIPPGSNLTGVIGGLSIFFDAGKNRKGATVYLDDVRYNNADKNMLRLIRSYRATGKNEDKSLRNAAFLYDNALTLLSYLAKGDTENAKRAKILADTLVWQQNHDRSYRDGRWRNAYLAVPVDLLADDSARLPGWWQIPVDDQGKPNGSAPVWVEDRYQISTDTGNMAWTVISLLAAHRKFSVPGQDKPYLRAALQGAEWIEQNCRVNETADNPDVLVGQGGGYSGGFDGWEDVGSEGGPKRLLWRSTEHNIDLYVAFMQLADLTGDRAWLERARHARSFVLKMYDPQEGHFLAGASDLDGSLNRDVAPLDVQTWSVLAMGHDPEFRRSIGWQVDTALPAPILWLDANVRELEQDPACDGIWGYRFSREGRGIWSEGTAQVAAVYNFLGRKEQAEQIISYLSATVFVAKSNPGNDLAMGMYAACPNKAETGFHREIGDWSGQWTYPRRLHIGATSWYLLARQGVNPFWMKLFAKSP
ncbi:MAG: hypothetical protein KKA54_17285, partial [Proteobacteria bacterium]|nr:hypothetical protein [Pseudomonadota bacterium]